MLRKASQLTLAKVNLVGRVGAGWSFDLTSFVHLVARSCLQIQEAPNRILQASRVKVVRLELEASSASSPASRSSHSLSLPSPLHGISGRRETRSMLGHGEVESGI